MSERPTPLTPRHRFVRVVIAWLAGVLLAIGIFLMVYVGIFVLGSPN